MMQLQTSSILNVPFNNYPEDFSFIVNGVEFKTSRIVADILSPVISKIHSIDPTINMFFIKTNEKGNFSRILDLVKFKQIKLKNDEIPFISEVIEILGIKSIEFDDNNEKIKIDNVFSLIKKQENRSIFYSQQLLAEIDFISSNFYTICESHINEFENLSFETLFNIIDNEKLQLNSEDQLLLFINKLYSKDSKYSIFYDNVLFENVSSLAISDFISIFKIDDINQSTWNRISARLEQDLNLNPKKIKTNKNAKRYRKQEENYNENKDEYEERNVKSSKSERNVNNGNQIREREIERNVNNRNQFREREIERNVNNRNQFRERRINDAWNFTLEPELTSREIIRTSRTGNNSIQYSPRRNENFSIPHEPIRTNINTWQQIDVLDQNPVVNDNIQNSKTFTISENVEFKGIINYLQKQSHSIDNEINITSSSVLNYNFSPKNVIYFEDRSLNFQSKDVKGSWICFEFKNHQVNPTNYEIRSRPCGEGSSHPKNWVIEGSNNKSNWVILDEQKNCEFLNGYSYVHSFSLNHPTSLYFKYIRMRLTGKDWQNLNILMINSFEIYGTIN